MSSSRVFARDRHLHYISSLSVDENTFEYAATEHLRLSAIYWSVAATVTCNGEVSRREEIIDFIQKCKRTDGGYGGSPRHDSHLLYTLSAVQTLILLHRRDLIAVDDVARYVSALQQSDGAFIGDEFGEKDTRFSYAAFAALSLIGRLDNDTVDVESAVRWLRRCQNFDGGFGAVPGAESHAGQIWCAVAALSLANALASVDVGVVCWWLAERQTSNGGLNGRPEKLSDVCYSWWVLAALSVCGHVTWIDHAALTDFILASQDDVDGGISDRPGDAVDIFHTFFGIAGLSLMGNQQTTAIDPVYALPKSFVDDLKLISTKQTPMPTLPSTSSAS